MNARFSVKVSYGSALLLLALLPSCKPFGGEDTSVGMSQAVGAGYKNDAAPVKGHAIVTINGKPFITKEMVAAQKERLLRNPQFIQMMAKAEPEQVDQFVSYNMVDEKIIEHYLKDTKIDQTPEFKEDLAALNAAVKQAIEVKYFGQKFPVVVTDAEIREVYDANKMMFMSVPGSVTAAAIQFDSEPAARTFMATVKQQNNDFKKAAQEAGLADKIKDFKSVTMRTPGIDPQLRDKIIAIKTVPSVELFTINGATWVVNATAKEEPQYAAFEQVKDMLKQKVEPQKQQAMFRQEIDKLKAQYKIELDKDYFKESEMTPEIEEEVLEEMLQESKQISIE